MNRPLFPLSSKKKLKKIEDKTFKFKSTLKMQHWYDRYTPHNLNITYFGPYSPSLVTLTLSLSDPSSTAWEVAALSSSSWLVLSSCPGSQRGNTSGSRENEWRPAEERESMWSRAVLRSPLSNEPRALKKKKKISMQGKDMHVSHCSNSKELILMGVSHKHAGSCSDTYVHVKRLI